MRRNVIVIGASAGGVEALQRVMAQLPADLPASVLVVLHLPSIGVSVLPSILNRAGVLPARPPEPGELLPAATVLVAPPDQHLVVDGDRVGLTRGPRENGHRPAVDVLFRTAAASAGERVIGVVLSGALDDGTAGLLAIKRHNGIAVVQDPSDAVYPSMPTSAIEHVPVDYVLPVADIGSLLTKLCTSDAPQQDDPPHEQLPERLEAGPDAAAKAIPTGSLSDQTEVKPGGRVRPSEFSYPDCGGVLWETSGGGGVARYRCRVGHAWSADGLLGQRSQQLDTALWVALRSLEEKAALARKMGCASRTEPRARERPATGTGNRRPSAPQRSSVRCW